MNSGKPSKLRAARLHQLLAEANQRHVAEDHLKEIDAWSQEIRDGKIPTSPKWR